MKPYEIAVLIKVRQKGVDADDAYNRAMWNLRLQNGSGVRTFHELHPIEETTSNEPGMGVLVKTYEHIMSKEITDPMIIAMMQAELEQK